MQRGVFTLQKLDILVSRSGSSQGARDWVNNYLKSAAEKYSNVKFNVIFSKDQFIHPRVTGYYLNGRIQRIILRNKNDKEVQEMVRRLHDRSGGMMNLKRWPAAKTETPSFQGKWSNEITRPFPFQAQFD
eukprot:UN00871